MAEGGVPDDDYVDPLLNEKDDDDEEVDRTQPFYQPGSSAPYHDGEEIPIQTWHFEKIGPPDTSFDETSFGGAEASSELAWISVINLFPNISATDLELAYAPNGRLRVKMVGVGKKSYDLFTMKRGTREQQLNPRITEEIKTALGKSIYEMRADVVQQTAEKEKQLEEAVSAADASEKAKDMNKIRNQMRQIDERREALEEKTL